MPGSSLLAQDSRDARFWSATFLSLNRRNINRALKTVLGKLNIPKASLYISHGFRFGAENELHERGAQWIPKLLG